MMMMMMLIIVIVVVVNINNTIIIVVVVIIIIIIIHNIVVSVTCHQEGEPCNSSTTRMLVKSYQRGLVVKSETALQPLIWCSED